MADAAETPAPPPAAAAPAAAAPAGAESAAATTAPALQKDAAPAAPAAPPAPEEKEYTEEELAADTARLKAQLAAMADTINSLSFGETPKKAEPPAAPTPAPPAAAPAASAAPVRAGAASAPPPAVSATPPAAPKPAASGSAPPAAAAPKPAAAPGAPAAPPAAAPKPAGAAASPAAAAPAAAPAPKAATPAAAPAPASPAASSPGAANALPSPPAPVATSPASPTSGGWNAWAEAMTGARSPLAQTLPVPEGAVRTVASALQALDGAVSLHAPSWMTKREEPDEPAPKPPPAAEAKELAAPVEGEDMIESCSSMLLPSAGASLIDLARVRTLLTQQAADVLTAAGYGGGAADSAAAAVEPASAAPALVGDPLRYLSGNASGGVVAWRADQEAGERLVATCGASSSVRCLLTLPDGLVATGSADGLVRLWRLVDGKCLREMTGHRNAVRGLAATATPGDAPEGCAAASLVLLSCSDDGGIRLWPMAASAEGASAALGTETDWHTAAVTGIAALGDGLIASSSRDASVRVWRLSSPLAGACARVLRGHGDAVYAVCHLGGTRCASGGEDGSARVWDAATGACLREFRHAGAVTALAPLSNGARDLLVTGCSDHAVRVWDAFGGEMECELHGHADGVTALTVARSATGAKIVSAAKDGTLCVWAWEGPGGMAGARERALRALPHEAVVSLAPLN